MSLGFDSYGVVMQTRSRLTYLAVSKSPYLQYRRWLYVFSYRVGVDRPVMECSVEGKQSLIYTPPTHAKHHHAPYLPLLSEYPLVQHRTVQATYVPCRGAVNRLEVGLRLA
jgi:hypothetical protein